VASNGDYALRGAMAAALLIENLYHSAYNKLLFVNTHNYDELFLLVKNKAQNNFLCPLRNDI
jgi:hypothetical protein